MTRAIAGEALNVSLVLPSASDDVVLPGLQLTRLTISSRVVDVTTGQGDGWRRLLSHAGLRTVAIEVGGLQLSSEGATCLRERALSGASADYIVKLGSGETLRGDFVIVRYHLTGAHDDVQSFELALDSAGPITLVA